MKFVKHLAFASLALLSPLTVFAGDFGEGYSSMIPNGPSDIRIRAFTIYSNQEACDLSAVVAEFRVYPNPLILNIGERIHRTNDNTQTSELVIEAYGTNGEFLPSVPVRLSTMDIQQVTATRSDWDYLEAVREGEDDLIVQWACATSNGVHPLAKVRIIVNSENSPNG